MSEETVRGQVCEKDEGSQAPRLSSVLTSIPRGNGYGPWWGTADGRWLYAEITERLGSPVAGAVNRAYGVDYCAVDVANTAVTLLAQDLLPRYILKSRSPWAYLAAALKRELIKEAGPHFRVELNDELLGPDRGQDRPATTLDEAVDATVACLQETAPAPGLHTVVSYLADRGAARISHAYTEAAAAPELRAHGLSREEILAVANAVLGSRRGGASVIAGFLADPAFAPSDSIPHRKALKKYRARMARINAEESLVG